MTVSENITLFANDLSGLNHIVHKSVDVPAPALVPRANYPSQE